MKTVPTRWYPAPHKPKRKARPEMPAAGKRVSEYAYWGKGAVHTDRVEDQHVGQVVDYVGVDFASAREKVSVALDEMKGLRTQSYRSRG